MIGRIRQINLFSDGQKSAVAGDAATALSLGIILFFTD